jgi:hypothetical protein
MNKTNIEHRTPAPFKATVGKGRRRNRCTLVTTPVLGLLALVTAFGGDWTDRPGSTRYPDIVFESAMPLPLRIHEANNQLLSNYRRKGLTNPKPHVLTTEEQTIVERAFEILPPLNRRVLTNHLVSIFFIEGMPNAAQTFPMERPNSLPLFGISVDSKILRQSASEWLTQKERTCFSFTNSYASLRVDCGTNVSAFGYILLHESSHIVDFCEHLSFDPLSGKPLEDAHSFSSGVWRDAHTPTAPGQYRLREQVGFYGSGKKIAADEAPEIYSSFMATPFASLYGSTSTADDFAEFVTLWHITHVLNQPYKIEIAWAGSRILSFQPMTSSVREARFSKIKRIYE